MRGILITRATEKEAREGKPIDKCGYDCIPLDCLTAFFSKWVDNVEGKS